MQIQIYAKLNMFRRVGTTHKRPKFVLLLNCTIAVKEHKVLHDRYLWFLS